MATNGSEVQVVGVVVDERAVREAWAKSWWLFVVGGILWLLFGFFVLSLRPGSITALAILIAIGFWLGALTTFLLAAVTTGAMRVVAIIGGIVAVGAGIAAIAWPEPTLVVLSVFLAWYLLIRGTLDVVVALMHTHVHLWWVELIAGIIGIGLGAWAIGNPDRSVLLFATIVGLWAIFKGVADIVGGFAYREMGKQLAAS